MGRINKVLLATIAIMLIGVTIVGGTVGLGIGLMVTGIVAFIMYPYE